MLFLIQVLMSSCDFIDFCVIPKSQPNVIKYYEPGKSCYVAGVFYTKCEDANGSK